MPRLFTALEVPQATGFALSLLKGGIPGARWIDPENYHVTLRFHGDMDGPMVDELCAAYDLVARPPVAIRFEGLGVFGSKIPHAIIARVAPCEDLMALQADLDRRALRLGLSADKRKFTPHITLARLKNARPADVADYLSGRGGCFLPDFTAGRFVMLSSRNSVGGGPYGLEADYPLTGSGQSGAAGGYNFAANA